MTKYAVAHYDLITGDLNLTIINQASNEVEACAQALVDINPGYDYTKLVLCKNIDELYQHISDDESITALPV
jgi:hypothetical protein